MTAGGRCCVYFDGSCGSMCWPVDRPGTHAAGGPAARGVWVFAAARGGGLGVVAVCFEGVCRGKGLTTGERVKESPAVFVFPWSSGPLAREIPDIFRHGWRRAGKFRNDGGGRCCVYFDGSCGSMCWPADRPGAHAAGGPAARGGWVFAAARGGGLGVVAVCSEGVCRGKGLTTGVVRHACRHRVTARGVFDLGDSFTRSGVDGARGVGFCFFL